MTASAVALPCVAHGDATGTVEVPIEHVMLVLIPAGWGPPVHQIRAICTAGAIPHVIRHKSSAAQIRSVWDVVRHGSIAEFGELFRQVAEGLTSSSTADAEVAAFAAALDEALGSIADLALGKVQDVGTLEAVTRRAYAESIGDATCPGRVYDHVEIDRLFRGRERFLERTGRIRSARSGGTS